jgi:2-iminoacetate synthase
MGYVPSFCTGCYRLGRTGADSWTWPNRATSKITATRTPPSTFMEYLMDYASPETRAIGEKLIEEAIGSMQGLAQERARMLVAKVRMGKHDMYC